MSKNQSVGSMKHTDPNFRRHVLGIILTCYGGLMIGDGVAALATKIQFGRSVHVNGRHVRVIYRYDNDVPQIPRREPKFYEEQVEDPLGPALEKYNGDWWAALKELRMTRQRYNQREITRIDLPSFKTNDETLARIAGHPVQGHRNHAGGTAGIPQSISLGCTLTNRDRSTT